LPPPTTRLRTSLASRSGCEVHDACRMLQQVVANLRELKIPIRPTPCHHRVAQRIEAHVMLNRLALNCTRTLGARAGMTMNRIRQAAAPPPSPPPGPPTGRIPGGPAPARRRLHQGQSDPRPEDQVDLVAVPERMARRGQREAGRGSWGALSKMRPADGLPGTEKSMKYH